MASRIFDRFVRLPWLGRKLTAHAVPEEQSGVQLLVDLADNAIIFVDSRENIRFFNAEAERLFGYSEDQILGAELNVLIPERFRENHRTHLQEFSESSVLIRRKSERVQIIGLRSDGTEFPAEASIGKAAYKGEIMLQVALRDVSGLDVIRKRIATHQRRLLEIASSLSPAISPKESRLVAGGQACRPQSVLRVTL